MKKEYIVFNQRLAGFLMFNKFPLKRMGKSDKEGSNKNVFFFNESEQLFKKIQEFKENLQ